MVDPAEIAAREWAPGSWRKYESLQMATYEDQETYAAVVDKLSKVPPLVQPSEVESLTALLAAAGRGERFIIQGGDCAERFMDCEGDRIEAQLKLVMQTGAIFEKATGTPAVRIARLAGQYGKPRSKPTETVAGHGEIYSFKGDNINGYEIKDRKWDPKRLLDGYWHSAATLNFVRSLQMGDDFEARMLGGLDIDYLRASPKFGAWSKVVSSIGEAAPSLKGARARAHLAPERLARARGHDGDDAHPCRCLACARVSQACSRRTRRCSSTSRRRSRASCRARARSTCRRTWCGSATARGSSPADTSSTFAASRTRSAASAGRAWPRTS